MEDKDLDKLYDLIYKLNEEVAELKRRSEEVKQDPDESQMDVVTDQEHVLVDPHSLGEYKNVSLPNGSVLKMRTYPMCVNGRHVINDLSDIVFCSRCGGAICSKHALDIDPPLCKNCIREEVGILSEAEIAVLVAVSKGVPFWRMTKTLKVSRGLVSKSLEKLRSLGFIRLGFPNFLRYETTMDGDNFIRLASFIYDI